LPDSSTPPDDGFQAQVTRLALDATSPYGFALAGGQALIAHGVVSRPTKDIDLFTDESAGVTAASRPVVDALEAAGLLVDPVERDGPAIYGLEDELLEYEVSDATSIVRIQLVHFDRSADPVGMAIGPVLHLDDLAGSKVAAFATRAEPRDAIDVAALLDHYDRAGLLLLARTADPALTDDELAEAVDRLDRTPDRHFSVYGLTLADVGALRARFADWPRSDTRDPS
jgi:hypothetical protein